jgi:hypothetical protein
MGNLFYVNMAKISFYLCSVSVIFMTFVRLQVRAVFTLIEVFRVVTHTSRVNVSKVVKESTAFILKGQRVL